MKLSDINPRIITLAIVGFISIFLIVFIISLLTRPTEEETLPTVETTSPLDQSTGVISTLPISITFSEELNSAQQANISFDVQPELELSQEWVNNKTLGLTSAQFPQLSTTYTITILYEAKSIYSFAFSTAAETQEQITEAGRIQAEEDFLFSEAEKEFYETYPWYSSIPIRTEDYVIVYNFEKEAFRIRLTLGGNPAGAQITAAKNRGLDSLEAIGVDLSQYDYYVVID